MKSEVSNIDSFNADLFKEELEKDLNDYFHSSNKSRAKKLMLDSKFDLNSSYQLDQRDFGDLSPISNKASINLNEGRLRSTKYITFTEIKLLMSI